MRLLGKIVWKNLLINRSKQTVIESVLKENAGMKNGPWALPYIFSADKGNLMAQLSQTVE
jgi:hypothetical protein